ncbi:MAG TPA: hypothetical protein VHM31_05335 [Polyangia bacterium]|nr:hypothetical protein [Polyangia bacterium]
MKELSPAARALVDAHRSDRTLTSAERKRIKNDVMLRAAAMGATTAVAAKLTTSATANSAGMSAGMSAGTSAGTSASMSAGMSLASKVAVVALSVTAVTGVVSVSVRALRARAHPHATPSETSPPAMGREPPQAVSAPAPRPTEGTTVARSATATPASWAAVATPAAVPARATAAARRVAVAAPAARRARRPAATPDVAAVPAASAAIGPASRDQVKASNDPPQPSTAAAPRVVPPDPEPELRVVRQARDDLRAGRPATAYRRLEEFDRQRGPGMLTEERQALSAIALCQWQPGGQARARAAEFLRSSPESPLAIRVRSACAQGSKASP